MFVKIKDSGDFQAMSKTCLMAFLKQHCDKSGRLTERLEVRQFVPFIPFVKSSANDLLDGDNVLQWVFSSFDVDRDLERVSVDGWDIKAFEQNPVVLWAHNHNIPAIGYAKNLAITDSLCGDVVFNEKEFDSFGWSIGERVKYGSIRSGSVGFLVKEIEIVDHRVQRDEKADIIYRSQELLEFSICNVPCNPHALQIDRSSDIAKNYNFFNQLIK